MMIMRMSNKLTSTMAACLKMIFTGVGTKDDHKKHC